MRASGLSSKQHLARAGPVERPEQLQHGRLARAARPHDRHVLAAGDLEVGGRHRDHLGRALAVALLGRLQPVERSRGRRMELLNGCLGISSPFSRCGEGRRRGAAARRAGSRALRRTGRRQVRGRWPRASAHVHGGFELHELRAGLHGTLAEPARGPPPRRGGPGAAAVVVAASATVAFSSGPIALTSAAPPTPISAPSTPPRAPWASASPVTWRTTSRCGQPIALSVPSSRVRLVTDESVRRPAIRNAASSPTAVSAPPSLPARSFASASEPVTRSARSWLVVVLAPGKPASIRSASAGHVVRAVGPHVHGVHPPLAVGHRLELGQLHVHVRGLSAERRRGEADDREALVAERHPVADREVLAGGVARAQDHLARVAGGEVVALRHLAGGHGAEVAVGRVHAAHAARVEVDVLGRARPRRRRRDRRPAVCALPPAPCRTRSRRSG